MLRAILNKSWRQHPTKQPLYSHLPPITKTIQVRQTRNAGHCWRSGDELISDILFWNPSHERAKVGRPARTYIQQLCQYRMYPWRPLRSDGRERRVAREGQRYPCWWHEWSSCSTLKLSGISSILLDVYQNHSTREIMASNFSIWIIMSSFKLVLRNMTWWGPPIWINRYYAFSGHFGGVGCSYKSI